MRCRLLICQVLLIFSAIPALSQERLLLEEGNAKYELGDYEGALAVYTEAIRINPEYAEAEKFLKILERNAASN